VAPSHRFLTYQKQFFLSLVGKITGEGVEHTTVAEKFCGNAVFFGTQLTTQLNADGCPIFLGHQYATSSTASAESSQTKIDFPSTPNAS